MSVRGPLVALVLLVATGCSSLVTPPHERIAGKYLDQVQPPPPATTLFNESRERRSFDGQPHPDSEIDFFGGWGLIEAPELKTYMDGLVQRLLENYPHDKPDIEVFVTSKRSFEAYATPYDDIFISLGVLENVESEDELAFLLGHEAAHLVLGHFRRSDWFQAEKKATELAAGAAFLSVALAGSEMTRTAQGTTLKIVDEQGVGQSLAIGLGAFLVAQELADTFFDPLWTRQQEDESDLLAMDLVVRAGWDASASIEALQKFQSMEATKEAARAGSRQQAYLQYARAMGGAVSTVNKDAIVKSGVAVAASWGANLLKELRDDMRSKHRLAVQREQALRAYHRREYRQEVAVDRVDVKDRIDSGETGQILEHHRRAHEAMEALDAGDVAGAEALAQQSIERPTSSAPFPRYVMYQVRKKQGRLQAGLGELEKIQDSPYASPIVFLSLADEYTTGGQPKKALAVLQRGVERFHYEPPFLPSMIAAHLANGDADGAKSAFERCRATGSDALLERCKERLPADKSQRRADAGARRYASAGLA